MIPSIPGSDPKKKSSSLLKNLGKQHLTPPSSDPTTRAELLQMVTPKPELDQDGINRQKSLAKMNAIGQAFGAFGQLAGIASGGDAVRIDDYTGPSALKNISQIDFNHQRDLQNYYQQLLGVNRHNNQLTNNEAIVDNRQEFRREELDAIQHREDLRYDRTRSLTREQRLTESGIDPSDPKADEKYIKYRQNLNKIQKQNAESIIKSRAPQQQSSIDPETMSTIMKGRDKKLKQLKADLKNLTKDNLGGKNDAQIKAINAQVQQLNQIEADPKSLLINELYGLGAQSESTQPILDMNTFSLYGRPGRGVNQNAQNLATMSPTQLIKRIRANPQDNTAIQVLSEAMVRKGLAKDLSDARTKILASN